MKGVRGVKYSDRAEDMGPLVTLVLWLSWKKWNVRFRNLRPSFRAGVSGIRVNMHGGEREGER